MLRVISEVMMLWWLFGVYFDSIMLVLEIFVLVLKFWVRWRMMRRIGVRMLICW